MGVTENPAAPGGVVEVANLTVWAADTTVTIDRSMGDPLLGPPPPVGPLRFDVDEAINRKIFLWPRGDLCKLRVDAIVNSTNESVNEVNGLSERIVATAGREIYDEIQALEGCRTGEAKMTAGFNLPARHVIHTVGPRFNVKYRTAAESALHNCYRSTLELLKESGLSTIGFSVINSIRRGYPPEAGAHIALRTIRRFLERFGHGIDAVVLCVAEEPDIKAYQVLLPQYFPRNADELEHSRRYLPEDVGNEWGEPVQEERRIRIGDIPRATRTALPAKSSLNQSVVSSDDPLTSWADPNREPEAVKEEIVSALAKVEGDHDEHRKEQIIQKAPPGVEEGIMRYNRWLRRAKHEKLDDLIARNILYVSGTDALGRTIVCVVGKNYSSSGIPQERTLMYLIHQLDSVVNKDYVVVFFNTDTVTDNRPDWSFAKEVYNILHPKYRRNLKRLYILHPTWWVWLAITIVNTFLISDVREKIQMVDSLQILYDNVPPSQVKVPDFVLDYDRRYYGEATNAAASNPDSL